MGDPVTRHGSLGAGKSDEAPRRLRWQDSLDFAPFPDLNLFPLLGPLTAPSWEEAPQAPRLPPPVHKTKVPLAMASSLFRVHELPSAHSQSGGSSDGCPERGKQVMVYRQIKRVGLGCGAGTWN